MTSSTHQNNTKRQLIEEIERLRARVVELEQSTSNAGDARIPQPILDAEDPTLEQLQNLVKTAPEPILLIDQAGRIVVASPEVEDLFGYDRDALVGKLIESLLPERFRREHKKHRRAFFADPKPRPMGSGRALAGLRRDGTEFQIDIGLTYTMTKQGPVAGAFFADITEHKRADDVRREDEQRLAVALSTIDLAIFNQDKHLRYTWMYQPQIGYAVADVIGKTDAELLPADAAETVTRIKRRVIDRNEGERREVRVEQDGIVHYFDLVVEPLLDRSGQIAGITGATLDITQSKQREQELRDSESRFRLLAENAQDAIFRYRLAPTAAFEYVSPAATSITGYAPEEFYAHPDLTSVILHPDDVVLRDNIPSGKSGGPFALRCIRKDGRLVWLELRITLVHDEAGNLTAVEGIARDVTERKQADERLHQQAQELAAAFQQKDEAFTLLDTLMSAAPVGMAFYDRELRCQRTNKALASINGTAVEDHLGRTVQELLPDLTPVVEPLFRRVIETGQPIIDVEIRGETPKSPGEQRDWLASYYPVVAHDGSTLGVGLIVMEITERKHQEEALRTSEARLREAQVITHIGNWELDSQTSSLLWSDEIYRIFEIDPQQFGASYEAFLSVVHPDDREIVNRAYTDSVAKHIPYEITHRLLMADGRIKYVQEQGRTFYDEHGKALRSIGTVQDITERKRQEETLRINEERLRQAVRASNIGIFDHDHHSDTIYWSPEQRYIYGWGAEESVTLAAFIKQVHPDDRERITEAVERAHDPAGDGLFDVEHRIIDRSGETHWLTTRSLTSFEGEGKARYKVRTVGAVADITKRKLVEDALRISEERLRLAVRVGNIGFFDHDHLANTVYWSPEQCAIYGWPPNEPVPLKAGRDHVYPEDLERIDQAVRRAHAPEDNGVFDVEYRITDLGGAIHWISTRSRTFFEGEGDARQAVRTVGAVVDITERKLAEERARNLHRVYVVLSNINQAIVRIRDLQELYDEACRIAIEDGGFKLAWIGLVDAETRQISIGARAGNSDDYLDRLAAMFNDGPSLHGPTTRAIRSGRPVICNDIQNDPTMVVMRTAALGHGFGSLVALPLVVSGEVCGVFDLYAEKAGYFDDDELRLLTELAQDISFAMEFAEREEQRRQAEESIRKLNIELEERVVRRTSQLRQSKERVETILDNSPDAILLLGPDGMIDTGNPMLSQWFGYTHDEVYGRPLTELAAPESDADVARALKEVSENLETRRLEIVARRKDGTTFDVTMALAPVVEGDHLLGVVCSLQDISKLKEVERMKDAFVSNVSHELRTPITSIKLNQELIRTNPADFPTYLDRMEREVKRLNTLIEDLLRLSRLDRGRTELELAPVDLNELVSEHVGDRLPIAESRSLKLSCETQPDLPVVLVDSGLIGQALSVLLTNALNYTPPSGTIIVRTQTRLGDGQLWAGFSVSDTGPGIPQEELNHLFDRFYRGKAGRDSKMPGTGLGLAIAHEIVSRHKGRIEGGNRDVAGKGAIFSVWLPLEPGADT